MVPSSVLTRPRRTCRPMARGVTRAKGSARGNQGLPISPATRSISPVQRSTRRYSKLSLERCRRSQRTRLPIRHHENCDATRKCQHPSYQWAACIRTHASQTETASPRPPETARTSEGARTGQGQSNIRAGRRTKSVLGTRNRETFAVAPTLRREPVIQQGRLKKS